MSKKLLIVESAKKAKTIKGMLGPGYTVQATSGHILEMPADDIHADLRNFTPTLHLIRGKGKKLAALKKAAAGADTVYLATDMDREGEAIAQHVAERLGRDAADKIRRITFTAITKADLQAALAAPRTINHPLVEAQTAARAVVVTKYCGENGQIRSLFGLLPVRGRLHLHRETTPKRHQHQPGVDSSPIHRPDMARFSSTVYTEPEN